VGIHLSGNARVGIPVVSGDALEPPGVRRVRNVGSSTSLLEAAKQQAEPRIEVKRLSNAEVDVIMAVRRPSCVVEKAVEGLNKHFGPRRILVATAATNCPTVEGYGRNVLCFDENAVLPGVTLREIAVRIEALKSQFRPNKSLDWLLHRPGGSGGHSVAGWWLQQFLKLGFASSPLLANQPLSEAFLLWDSDMVLLDHFDAFTPSGKMPLMAGGKMHKMHGDACPYGHTYKSLTGHKHIAAPGNKGYVPHHMVMHKAFLQGMLHAFGGQNWMWRVLGSACDGRDVSRCQCGFSEYQSYATWMKMHHPYAVVDLAENFTRASSPYSCCPLTDAQMKKLGAQQLFVGLEQGGCTKTKL
jgi:hypothetical protein